MESENNMNIANPWNHDFWNGERRSFRPWFDPKADYNTNAQSYYDYLAHLGAYLDWIIEFIDDLYRRDIHVKNTNTIEMFKDGEWLNPKHCCGDDPHEHDIETLSAEVIISKKADNAIVAEDDGLYASGNTPGWVAFKKILLNLESAGFWIRHDPNNIFDGDLAPNLWLMMGNMNIDSVQNGTTRSIKSNINGFDNNDLMGGL